MRAAVKSLAALVLLVQLALTATIAAAGTSGTWSIETRRDGDATLTLTTSPPGERGSSINSHDVDVAALGISHALSAADRSAVEFTLAREAGLLVCTGTAGNGAASGAFAFTASIQYVARMRERGYTDLSGEDLLRAATLNITTAFVDGIIAAGYPRLPFEKLIPFRALGIDGPYLRAMREAFRERGLRADDAIPLRALGATAHYVQDMRDAGLSIAEPEDAIRARALNIDLEYVREVSATGYARLPFEDLARLRALGIDAAYIKRVQAHGFAHPSIEELIRLKTLNVIALGRASQAS
jgi:uncharacterized metal-binding protein